MLYGCHECGSPAVVLPERLDEDAVVHCQGCRKPIATWAVFKHITTQAVLADFKEAGAKGTALSYDPLDPGLPHRMERVVDT
jgi:predicted nucleic acid-binding Zn ribbon protein